MIPSSQARQPKSKSGSAPAILPSSQESRLRGPQQEARTIKTEVRRYGIPSFRTDGTSQTRRDGERVWSKAVEGAPDGVRGKNGLARAPPSY